MKTNLLIKILVLSCFVILISGFVAYRSGAFTEPGPEPTPGKRTLVDTPDVKTKKDSIPFNNSNSNIEPIEIMSSSKSGEIFPEDLLQKDTQVITPKETRKDSAEEQRIKLIMGSSKSGKIFTPKKDTAKKKP